MRGVNGVELLIFSLLCMGIPMEAQYITMNIALENISANNIRPTLFDKRMFRQFYLCMCDERTQNCVANYIIVDKKYNVTKVRSYRSVPISGGFSNLYRCNNKQSQNWVICSKSNSYGHPHHVQSFRHLQTTSCDLNCVKILWNFSQERIIVGSLTEDVELNPLCNSSCNGMFGNCDEETEKNDKDKTNADDDDNAGTVVGIVVTLIIVAVIAVIVFFVWRRRKHSSKPPEQNRHLAGTVSSSCNGHNIGQINRLRSANTYEGNAQPSCSTTDRDCSDATDDYNYIVGDNTQRPYISKPKPIDIPASSSTETNNITHKNDPDYGYSSIYPEKSTSSNDYSRLGEKRRDLKNPYDGLLHPKQDPSLRPPPNVPAQTNKPANQLPDNYSLAQPTVKQDTDIINVDKMRPMANGETEDGYNYVDEDYLEAGVEDSKSGEILTENYTSGTINNMGSPYFELEKEEGMEEKDYSDQGKTEPPYFELEKEGDISKRDYET